MSSASSPTFRRLSRSRRWPGRRWIPTARCTCSATTRASAGRAASSWAGRARTGGARATERERERQERVAKLSREEGMEPAQVADIVVEAIKNEQFWILTHDYYDDQVPRRMGDILARNNPMPFRPP